MTTNNILLIKARRCGMTSYISKIAMSRALGFKYRDNKGRFAKDPYRAFVREREYKWLFNEAQ